MIQDEFSYVNLLYSTESINFGGKWRICWRSQFLHNKTKSTYQNQFDSISSILNSIPSNKYGTNNFTSLPKMCPCKLFIHCKTWLPAGFRLFWRWIFHNFVHVYLTRLIKRHKIFINQKIKRELDTMNRIFDYYIMFWL